jgi:hypothetical protein
MICEIIKMYMQGREAEVSSTSLQAISLQGTHQTTNSEGMSKSMPVGAICYRIILKAHNSWHRMDVFINNDYLLAIAVPWCPPYY